MTELRELLGEYNAISRGAVELSHLNWSADQFISSILLIGFVAQSMKQRLHIRVWPSVLTVLVDELASQRSPSGLNSFSLQNCRVISHVSSNPRHISLFDWQVSHCLDEILNLCQSFSSLLLQTGSTGLTQRELTQIENITKVLL